MKALYFSAVLVALAALWFAAGYNYANDTAPMEFVSVPDPYEVRVEVPVEVPRTWEKTLVLGVMDDGRIMDVTGDNDRSAFYALIYIRSNGEVALNEVVIWIPFGEMWGGIPYSFAADKYEIEVEIARPYIEPPQAQEDGDEF